MPGQYFRKISFVSKYKIGTNFAANDTINNTIKYYNNYKILLPINTMMDTIIADNIVLVFTPPQPITEITPFQMEAILTLSDGSVVRATSPKVYLGI